VSLSKPSTVRLSELIPGQYADFFALLAERNRNTTRDGKPYYSCRFQDAERSASFLAWADSTWFEPCEREWQEGLYYKIRGVYSEHEKYGPQIDIHNIREVIEADTADGFDQKKFVPHSRFDPEQMFAELRALAASEISDQPLRQLVATLLDGHAEALKCLPATLNKFYPFQGGLLEHTLSVTRKCLYLATEYSASYPNLQPPLNRDLVVAGAILHDIGRVIEFTPEGAIRRPTIPGRLFGHLFLGRDLIREVARDINGLNSELVQLLEHIVIAHLNLPEWGSPRLPLIPECLIVHHADDLDAKLEMYIRCLTRDRAQGPFTDRDPILNRQLFKGRSI
jgi:3'-5' exoribonuclease